MNNDQLKWIIALIIIILLALILYFFSKQKWPSIFMIIVLSIVIAGFLFLSMRCDPIERFTKTSPTYKKTKIESYRDKDEYIDFLRYKLKAAKKKISPIIKKSKENTQDSYPRVSVREQLSEVDKPTIVDAKTYVYSLF